MQVKNEITITDALSQAIEKWPPDQLDAILHVIDQRAKQFQSYYGQGSPVEFVKAFYEAFDEVMSEVKKVDKNPVSCKRGCFFCCRQNVSIWSAEADLIAEYCKVNGIEIPKEYLQEQLKHGWKEVAQTEVGWCVFLKNGECSIYSVRPLMCRKYHVASPPELCDTVKYPSSEGHRVAVCVYTLPEIEASAFAGVMDKMHNYGRMPQMLLKYSK